MNELEIVLEYLNEGNWFQQYHDEIETHAGDDVYSITVTSENVIVSTIEKFGSSDTPFADDPSHHIEQLNNEHVAMTEGSVTYEDGPTTDDYPLTLPKFIYFDNQHSFDVPVSTVPQLQEALEDALGACPDLEDVVSVAQENGDL